MEKMQDVETWKSDVVKGVILAANDGDRAAWQEWIFPAIADNPDLDALNYSGGSRFQSIDTNYAHHEQRIAFLKSGRNFVLSSVEGPHSTREFGTNLQWRQYMRRLSFYAALSYNILTDGQLDSHMIGAGEYEWLKLYHYFVTSTELIRCKGYPVTEVLAMLTIGVEETVKGDRLDNTSLGNPGWTNGMNWEDR